MNTKKLEHNILMELYIRRRCISDIRHLVFSDLKEVTEGAKLLEIFKKCIREYASRKLEDLTVQSLVEVDELWKLHYSLEQCSYQAEEFVKLYYQFYQTEQSPRIDFTKFHFDEARQVILELPMNSRAIHYKFKLQYMNQKQSMVEVCEDSYSPVLIFAPKRKKKTSSSIACDEFKLFEYRISQEFNSNRKKVEPYLSETFTQRYKVLLHKK